MKNDAQKILLAFLHFLKSEKVLKHYLNHLKTQGAKRYRWSIGEHTLPEIFLQETVCTDPGSLISRAFSWEESIYGSSYWLTLHRSWMEKLHQIS